MYMMVELSPGHVSILKKLRGDTGVEDLSVDPVKTMAAVDARYSFTSTRVAITALRKVYPDVKLFKDEMIKRRVEYKKIDTAQEPTERQKAKFIPWDDIIELRGHYWGGMTNTEQLLISLYTMIPPARADYTPMKIVGRKPKKPEDGFNYLVLRPKSAHFLFHAFKNHKTIGDRYVAVPNKLLKVIQENVTPDSKYLLEHDGKPWTEAQLGDGVRKIFQRYLDMDTGISMIRHAYATNIHAGEKSIKDNEKIAHSMMHSPDMSQAYRFISLE